MSEVYMATYTKTLTVDEVITKLQALSAAGHGARPVTVEGCDCYGDAGDVQIKGDEVCILRTCWH